MTDETVMQVTASPSYKLAIIRGCLHGAATAVGAILAALSGVVWAEATGQEKFMIVLGICGTLFGTAAAFFDKTMARLGDGKTAIANGTTPPIQTQQPPP